MINEIPDSRILILMVAATLLFFLLTGFIVSFLFIYKKRKEYYYKEKQNMQSNFQQELLKTRLEIQEETFRNISQEIHDNIGQSLSFVKLNLNTVDPYNADVVIEKLTESRKQLTKTIQDLRDIARSLSPDFLSETGLTPAIQQQLQMLDKTQQYHTGFTVRGELYKVNLQKELVLYRIVQELLNNIVKHAGANEVTVVMDYFTDKLAITITDNGKGFDYNLSQTEEGLGLRNMYNRINMINGIINIQSSPGNGVTATIELPLQENEKI